MHFKLKHNSSISRRRWVSLAFTLLATGVVAPAAASPTVVTIRSGDGNVNPGQVDGNIFNDNGAAHNLSCRAPLSQSPFSTANFSSASINQLTYVVNPTLALANGLLSDTNAKWVNWSVGSIPGYSNIGYPPSSALYRQNFYLPVQNVCSAKMKFCWVVDDLLGDSTPFPGANPAGVYINGVAIPAIHGGDRFQETCATIDVTNHVLPGANTLYVYVRDAGCFASGVMYSAQFTVETNCCKDCAGKSSADVNDQLVTQTVCAPDLATAEMSAQTASLSVLQASIDNACGALHCDGQSCSRKGEVHKNESCQLSKTQDKPSVSCLSCVKTGRVCKDRTPMWTCNLRETYKYSCKCSCAPPKD